MPTLVTDLTPLQRMWLYENQRTLSEEVSPLEHPPPPLPPGTADDDQRYHASSDRKRSPLHDKSSIFRTRSPATIAKSQQHHHQQPEQLNHQQLQHSLPSSSPSWNAHHNDPMPPATTNLMTPFGDGTGGDASNNSSVVSVTPNKRRKMSFPGYHHHNHPPPSYLDYPPPHPPSQIHYNHPNHQHQHHPYQHHYRPPPPAHPTPKDLDRESVIIVRSPRLQSPDSEPREKPFPNFPHKGDKLTWQESYDNLVAYKEHYGDCNVPQKYKGNPKLGTFEIFLGERELSSIFYGGLVFACIARISQSFCTSTKSLV